MLREISGTDRLRTSFNGCEVDARSIDEFEGEIAELCTHIDAAEDSLGGEGRKGERRFSGIVRDVRTEREGQEVPASARE